MEYHIVIGLEGIPKRIYEGNVIRCFDATAEFGRLPADQGDLLVVAGFYDRSTAVSIYHRNGAVYSDALDRRYPPKDEKIVLVCDDFTPGMTQTERYPEWCGLFQRRIISVQGEAVYGSSQGVKVTERIVYHSAVGMVRNTFCGIQPCFHVKISAKGQSRLSSVLADAMALHQFILEDNTRI